jgi:hypothetical protein
MKKHLLTIAFLVLAGVAFSTTTIVDINGAGQFTSIQLAINNSSPGDTIQVWPGTYTEAVTLNKNLVLQGSGYENTIITGAFAATVTISNGLMKWFFISSNLGVGVSMNGGHLHNCIIKGCASYGVWVPGVSGSIAYIQNCNILNNGGTGINVDNPSIGYAVNCISKNNVSSDFEGCCNNMLNVSYSDGSTSSVANSQGMINTDPLFVSSTNYHLASGSQCIDSGQPSLSDPDGTISDMGYFGGPDCPIFPVVYQMTITPNGNNINVTAKARANY